MSIPSTPWSHCRTPAVCDLIRQAAILEDTTPRTILSGDQHANVVRARVALIHALRARGHSSTFIGRELGGMHHTTVLYHLQKANRKQTKPPEPPYNPDQPDESGIWAI